MKKREEEEEALKEPVKIHVNPKPPPEQFLTFAYGDQRFKKLKKNLGGKTDELRIKALIEINEDFHQADKIYAALDEKILGELFMWSRYFEDEIRELASRAILKVALTEKGRELIIYHKAVCDIMNLFDDHQVQVRNNAYVSLINLADFRFGVDSIIDEGILPVLIDKLVLE